MEHNPEKPLFAFPSVQEQDQLVLVIQSLVPLHRNLTGSTRQAFEDAIQRLVHLLPAYKSMRHLTPMEFILLGFILGLIEKLAGDKDPDHPPFP